MADTSTAEATEQTAPTTAAAAPVSDQTATSSASTSTFRLPTIIDNPIGWGPCPSEAKFERFSDVPYVPFNKGDRVGKVADWTGASTYTSRYPQRFNASQTNNMSATQALQQAQQTGNVFAYFHEEDDDNFKLVDSGTKPKQQHRRGRYQVQSYRRSFHDSRRQQQQQHTTTTGRKKGYTPVSRFGRRWQRWSGRRWQGNYSRDEPRRELEASVRVLDTWKKLDTYGLAALRAAKFSVDPPKELTTAGEVEFYGRGFDNITTKTEKHLRRNEKSFYKVTTSDDTIIRELAVKQVGNVFATDDILSMLMCSSKSVFPWDVVLSKVGNTLFFDRRENSQQLEPVSETAQDIPTDDKDNVNSQANLSQEARFINQCFSQQVLDHTKKHKFSQPNPFAAPEESVASVGYRYRSWDLGDGITLVSRCEVDAATKSSKGDKLVKVRALHEFERAKDGAIDWRLKLDTQRSSVLAVEFKNNSNRISQWATQAVLAGADQFLLGYVSRVNMKDSYNHVVLGAQLYEINEFVQQIQLNIEQGWGSLKALLDKFMQLEDGKYLLMKEPNKPELHLYSVPLDSFMEDEEDEEEEEEELPEGDEDDIDEYLRGSTE